MDEGLALALLQAGIAGAGLVLAVYALIVPRAAAILQRRIDSYVRSREELRKRAESPSDEDLDMIKRLTDDIMTKGSFPNYLGIGVVFAFVLYCGSSLMALFWLLDIGPRDLMAELLRLAFTFGTVSFLLVGFYSICDIHSLLKREFERRKKEAKVGIWHL